MKRNSAIHRILPLLLVLLAALPSLCLPARAEEDAAPDYSRGFGGAMEDYIAANGLTEDNFAFGWYDVTTGESWFFGENTFMYAGSMYKVPLCMIYADMLDEGLIEADDYVGGGFTAAGAMEYALLYSNNDAAQAMRYYLSGDLTVYRNMLAQYSMLDVETFPKEYYSQNRLSPRYLINTLQYLYENSDFYADVLDYMTRAQQENYFCKGECGYKVAHKYGSFNSCVDDCGIVYAERPCLLAAFIALPATGETMLGEICDLAAGYSDYVVEQERLAAEEQARLEAEEKARLEAEEKARLEAEAEEKARLEAEEKARLEAEAEEKARLEAEDKAAEQARLEAAAAAEDASAKNRNLYIAAGLGALALIALAVLLMTRFRPLWAKALLLAALIGELALLVLCRLT